MNEKLSQLVKSWKEMRHLTLDLLDKIPEKHLAFTVGKNMGTIGKQYRHIGDVQICYNEAIKTGKIDFDKYKRDYLIESSKEKLKIFLFEVNEEMLILIKKNPDIKINWFGEEWDLEQHIQALIEHEILHHGELVVYIKVLDLQFPKSWDLWGL